MELGILESVYTTVKTSKPVGGLIILASFIAIIFIVKRFVDAWKQATVDNKHPDMKMFFNLFWSYFIVFIVIIALPVFVYALEKSLASFQTQMIDTYSASLDFSIDEAMEYYEKQYTENEGGEENMSFDIPLIGKPLYNIYTAVTESLYLLFLYMAKYLFFLFSCGRYLYLILLEIMAPLAIVCVLSESTKQYFFSWCKHLIICYMLIPAFLLANTFSEEAVKQLFVDYSMNELGLVGLVLMVLLKFYLFSFSQKQVYNLL